MAVSQLLQLSIRLTRKRLINAMLLYTDYFRSRISKKAFLTAMPISIGIEPTTSCNLRCPQCPSGLRTFTRNTGAMDFKLYTKIIDELHPFVLYQTLYFQGEPFLNRDFLKMVQFATDKGIYTCTSTNGHYLDEKTCEGIVRSGLNKLIISVDGVGQQSYETYRVGGDYNKVIKGIKTLVLKRKELKIRNLYIELQFVVFKHNQNEINTIQKLSKDLEVDACTIKSAQVYNFESDDTWLPDEGHLSRYKKTESGTALKSDFLNYCWRMWHSAVITWDGNVVPCCFDKDASHVMGNLREQTFKDIWFSVPYFNFRNTLLNSRSNIDICKNCTEGLPDHAIMKTIS